MAGLSEQICSFKCLPVACLAHQTLAWSCATVGNTLTPFRSGLQVGDTLCEQGEKLHLAAQALEAVASGDKALQILLHMLPSVVQLEHLCTAIKGLPCCAVV